MRTIFPRSNVLVLGPNSIQSLVPSTLISQVESLLDSHRIEDAVDLAENQRKKLYANISPNEDELDELRYVYQRIGFQCLSETLFEDAGKYLFNGDLDPRLLISYYPELRGGLFSSGDELDVFAGVAERMPTEASIDDIVVINLVRNYSPHLAPNTRSAPPTAELRKILVMAANEMLEVFLRKWRVQGGTSPVVDTVLAKLYAEFEKTQDLYVLVAGPNQIVVEELEPVLRTTGQYKALCMLYQQKGDDLKLLGVWARLIEGEWTDEDIKDPVSDMTTLLTEKRDRPLMQKWGLWLTRRDPARGLKLLMPKDSGKRRERPDEDLALLEQIMDANAEAGVQFLEYLVLQRRSNSRSLHTRLVNSCIDQLCISLADDSVSKLWRAKAASFASSSDRASTSVSASFLSYFASTTPDSPHKRIRLKTILLLAGSSLYDAVTIRPRILEHQKILRLELAIIDGKLGNHRSALTTLVHDLHDSASAEAYCTLGGDVVPPRVVLSIAESHAGLDIWTTALFGVPIAPPKPGVTKPVATPIGKQKSMNEGLKKELLKILLEVYMGDGEASAGRAAHLLSSQAMNLDVLDVIPLVPPDWPLKAMSSFLERSFRRTIHARHEGQIVKTLSAGQNLVVKDEAWLVLREEGMIIEEPVEDDDAGDEYDEKQALAEKVASHLGELTPPIRHDIAEPGEKGREGDQEAENGYILRST